MMLVAVVGQDEMLAEMRSPGEPAGPSQLERKPRMPYWLSCSDTPAACPFTVITETEDELMQHVAAHVSMAHPDLELTAETVAEVRGLIGTFTFTGALAAGATEAKNGGGN
jgi:predicted small metal-binding protein